jgi:hypothetical protein
MSVASPETLVVPPVDVTSGETDSTWGGLWLLRLVPPRELILEE